MFFGKSQKKKKNDYGQLHTKHMQPNIHCTIQIHTYTHTHKQKIRSMTVVVDRPYAVTSGYDFTTANTLSVICAYRSSGTSFVAHTSRIGMANQAWQSFVNIFF